MTVFLQRVLITMLALAGCAWLGFLFAGRHAADWIAAKFSGPLRLAADGKFDDPAGFVHGRLEEGLFLLTLGLALCLAMEVLRRWLCTGTRWSTARGVILGVAGFCLLNIFVLACGRTVLFWVPFYHKVRIDNLAQYHIKRALMEEIHEKRRVVVMGSSQANRAIDEVLMNREIGESLWTTELSQPGARGFDMLTLARDIPLGRGDVVVCYLSEIMFYGEGSGIVAADFLNFPELPDIIGLGGWEFFAPGSVRSGLLGRVLPVYRFRESLSHRILGWPLVHLDQTRFDSTLEPDLEEQAARRAPGLRMGAASDFEKAAFGRMIGEVIAKGCTVVVLAGHTHPVLHGRLDGEVTKDLEAFLAKLAALHPTGMRLLDAAGLFEPTAADFADLVHFNEEAQHRFTLALADRLATMNFADPPQSEARD